MAYNHFSPVVDELKYRKLASSYIVMSIPGANVYTSGSNAGVTCEFFSMAALCIMRLPRVNDRFSTVWFTFDSVGNRHG